jgi:hypothetical protein
MCKITVTENTGGISSITLENKNIGLFRLLFYRLIL